MLKAVSDRIARGEVFVAASLAGGVTLLVLLNIASRAMGHAIYWVDELAIYCMVWMTFFTTSVLLKKRQSVAVTILTDCLNDDLRRWLATLTDLMVLLFATFLLYLCWNWYDPITLIQQGFDLQAFQAQTFNFMYAENTNTLGLKKFWIWLALPLFSLSLSVHALSNLIDQLRPAPAVAGETL